MGGIVVIGAGQAGCQLVSSLRDEGYDGALTLLGEEAHPPYQRPPLSKAHLSCQGEPAPSWLRPATWFAEQGIDLRLSTRVASVDRARRTVSLLDGSAFDYEVLVLALGSRHRDLQLPGDELDGVMVLRTLDEADALRQRLAGAQDVVVVGGGFIGLEVAATAAKAGKRTTVLEVAPQLMGRVLSTATAHVLLDAHRRRGVDVRLGTSATALSGVGGAVQVVDTDAGERLRADLVLLGVGAVANDELARRAGLAVDAGIVVDALGQTSDPAVYALGDCVRGPSPHAPSGTVRIESVQNATAQARSLARTLTGRPTANTAVPWFWSDQGDVKIQIAGLGSGHDVAVLAGDTGQESFSTWCFRAGRLVAVESVNRPGDHMLARRLLQQEQLDLTADDVRRDNFDPKSALASASPRVGAS